MAALEGRVTNLDTRVDRQLNAVAGKMSSLENAIIDLKTSMRSSWHTIVIIGASVLALGTFAVSIINLYLHH